MKSFDFLSIPVSTDELLDELIEKCGVELLEPVRMWTNGKNWKLSDESLRNLIEKCVKKIVLPLEIDENLAGLMIAPENANVDEGRASTGFSPPGIYFMT